MRLITMPLPSIDQLDIEIEIHLDDFVEQYMRYVETAVEKVNGTRLRYQNTHIKDNRICSYINLTDLPSFASACYLDYGFERAVLESINQHKHCGTKEHPKADWAMLHYYDMRAWPDTWVSAYLWVILKIDFLRQHDIRLGMTNTDFIANVVCGVNKEELLPRQDVVDAEIHDIMNTHLDRTQYKQILSELSEDVLLSAFAFRAEPITVTEAVFNGKYEDVIGQALSNSLRITTLLAQDIKENANFFEVTTSMRTLKMPLPAISALAIKNDPQEFAEAYLFMMSDILSNNHETRLHYNNVRVIDDHVYADINLKRLPAIDGDFGAATLEAINNHELSGTDECPIATLDMLKYYDIRRLHDTWLICFLSELIKGNYRAWHNKPSSFSDQDMIAAIVEQAGSINSNRPTLQDRKDAEFEDAQNEYAVGDPRDTVEVLVNFGNALIKACNEAALPAIQDDMQNQSRQLPHEKKEAVIDEYTEKLMLVTAERLWRIREDDDHIKSDYYYW